MNNVNRYKELVEVNPTDIDSWVNLGDAYYDQADFNNAIKAYEKALELDPLSSEIWNNLGLINSYIGEYETSIECYKKALEIDPDDAITYYNMGFSYEDIQDYENAIKAYKKAIEIDPNYTDSYNNIALIYRERDLFSKNLYVGRTWIPVLFRVVFVGFWPRANRRNLPSRGGFAKHIRFLASFCHVTMLLFFHTHHLGDIPALG